MGRIGSFAGVSFEVSTKKVSTFDDLSRGGSARWSAHDIATKKPMPEFLGPGLETLSLKIRFSAFLGVNPESELNKLISFRDQGKYSKFVIGTKAISSGYWYIDSLTVDYRLIDGKGRIHAIDVSLNLTEYPKPVVAVVKNKPKPKPPAKKKPAPSKKKTLGVITIKVGMLNCRATPSLKGRILKVLRKGQKYTAYGIKRTDIPWYDLGGGKWTSAVSKYTSLKKA